IWVFVQKTEGQLHEQAQREYDKANFAAAAKTFGRLVKEFPKSESLPVYRFFTELSETRQLVYSSEQEPEEASEKLDLFLKDHSTDELLKQHKADVWETLLKLTEGLAELAERKHDRHLLALA